MNDARPAQAEPESPEVARITGAIQALRGDLTLLAQALHERAARLEELAAQLWAMFGV